MIDVLGLSKIDWVNRPRLASLLMIVSLLVGGGVAKFWIDNAFWSARFALWASILPLFGACYLSYANTDKFYSQKDDWVFGKSVLIVGQYALAIAFAQIFDGYMYSHFVEDALLFLPFMIIGVPFYVKKVNQVCGSDDEYARFWQDLWHNRTNILTNHRQFLLKSLLKIIFLPYMYGGAINNLMIMQNTPFAFDTKSLSLWAFNFCIMIDMIIGIFGYLFATRLINNHIKKVDDNVFSWFFTLICYPPLVWLGNYVNDRQEMYVWHDVIPSSFMPFYATLLGVLWVLYLLASVEFGTNFANLSYRRLIYRGVYAYTKHPAYLFKNLYWWLHILPFLSASWFGVQWWQNVLGLAGVSFVYFMRAKYEERFCMQFEEYRTYANYINQNGRLARFKK